MRRHQDYVLDRAGNVTAGAEVYVRKQADNSLLSLYSDNGITPTSNPLTTDNDGEFAFYTANNDLKIQVFVNGVNQQEVTHFQHYDLAAVSTYGWSLIAAASAPAAATLLGLGTSDSPQFAALNVGHASDTTLTRASAGDINIAGNIAYRAGGTDVAVADGGTGASTQSGARSNLGLGSIATFDESTAAQYRANTSGKALSTDKVWSAADTVALTPGANVAVDLSTGINFTLAMGGNYTLDNPTNAKPGQAGFIKLTQDGTGSRTLAFGSNYLWDSGTDGVLSTSAGAKDVLYYQVLSATEIHCSLRKAIA